MTAANPSAAPDPKDFDPVVPKHTFDARVRVSVSIHSEDEGYLRKTLQDKGWNVTQDTRVETPATARGRLGINSHLLVDIPVSGISRGAEDLALVKVIDLLEPHGTMVDVRGAWMLQPSAVRSAQYRVYRRFRNRRGLHGKINRLLVRAGARDTGEVIYAASAREAREEFIRRHQLHNAPARPERPGLRRASPDSTNRPDFNGGRYRTRQDRFELFLFFGIWFAGIAATITFEPYWSPTPWNLLLLALCTTLYGLALYKTHPGSFSVASTGRRAALAAIMASSGTALGILTGENQIINPWSRFALPFALFTFFGLRRLLRGSKPGRIVLWAAPLFLSLMPPLLRLIAEFTYNGYLTYFDMTATDVSLPTIDQVTPALKPLGTGLLALLATLAIAGYLLKMHIDLGRLLVIPLILVYGLAVVASASINGHRAGWQAYPQATSHTIPHTYYGLKARPICVKPTSATAAVQGANLPVGSPLLTFDPFAPRVAVWNPTTGGVSRVQAANAVITTIADLNSPCP
ncbi:hypothetical protein [Kitasatospora aureofaciens]|uniref:hypothetical protein n=1 Tax=Kitasatospora aureofaciens TaxID=1894 RepID=UPI0037CA6CC2